MGLTSAHLSSAVASYTQHSLRTPKMRLLTRYILREVFSHALLGGVLFTFVLFTSRLRPLLETLVRNSASLADVFRLILYLLPQILIVTIPMAVLVGILLGLSRLLHRARPRPLHLQRPRAPRRRPPAQA